MAPQASVVMPTYNAETFIEQSVPAILGQSFSDFELLVLDGGSTDGTVEYVRDINDDRILIYEEAGGITEALNKGLDAASGEYVARADADSIPEENWLKKCISFLERNPAYAAVGTQVTRIRPNGETFVTDKPVDHDAIVRTLPWRNPMIHPTLVMRKDIARAVGGYRERHWEDYDLVVRLAQNYQLSNLSEALVSDYLHDESIVGSTSVLKATLASLRCGLFAIRIGDYSAWGKLGLSIKRVIWAWCLFGYKIYST